MKFKDAVKSIINYIAAVGLAVVFALFMSGRIGWFLVAAFVCSPLISVLITMMFAKNIQAEAVLDNTSMCKGDEAEMTITVYNSFFLPSPPITFEISDTPQIYCKERFYSVSVMPFAEESFNVKYTAKMCGPVKIGAEKIRVSDYFGLLSFEIKSINIDELAVEGAIIPDIMEVSMDNELIKSAEILAQEAEDSEDTAESSFNSFSGFPGYDSREYIPGDPLKRVNWKQSVKRGKMLVRLDDETACSSVSIVLDCTFEKEKIFLPAVMQTERFADYTDKEILYAMAQYSVEQSLGFAQTLLRLNYSVTYLLYGKNGWQTYYVTDESDIALLRTDLARYSFLAESINERFPVDTLSEMKGNVSIYFTPYLDEVLYEQLYEYITALGKNTISTVASSAAVSPKLNVRKEDNNGN